MKSPCASEMINRSNLKHMQYTMMSFNHVTLLLHDLTVLHVICELNTDVLRFL